MLFIRNIFKPKDRNSLKVKRKEKIEEANSNQKKAMIATSVINTSH